jgi:2-methylisocitrate lyase-like PEP mutase family enzyme
MANLDQAKKAEALRAMHLGADVLLLPNAWDAASARIIEEAGFPAIATTSAGIAFAHGYPDGQKIPSGHMIGAIAQIAAAVKVPVTADVEAGYGERPEHAGHTARRVIEAGAVGMNFEDARGDARQPLVDLPLQLEKIRVGDPAKRYDEAVRRLSAFRDAGADCVFVPGLREAATIRRLVADLRCPVNVLAIPGSPSVAELASLGVRRISLGSGPMRATLGLLRRLAEELKTLGTYTTMEGAPSHAEMNELMKSN